MATRISIAHLGVAARQRRFIAGRMRPVMYDSGAVTVLNWSRVIVSLSIGIAGGVVGTLFALWAQGRNVENVGAAVAMLSTIVAVIGLYHSSRSQRELLHLQLLNEARHELRRAIHREKERLSACSTRIHDFRFFGDITPQIRTDLVSLLQQATQHPAAFDWIFSLEENATLFPEARTARIQLLMRAQKLHEEFRRFAGVLRSAGALPPRFDAAAEELWGHIGDQSALLGDLSVHIQNRALGAVSGHSAPERTPPDPKAPRLVLDDGQLAVQVPDPTTRVQMEVAGWLPPRNPPGA